MEEKLNNQKPTAPETPETPETAAPESREIREAPEPAREPESTAEVAAGNDGKNPPSRGKKAVVAALAVVIALSAATAAYYYLLLSSTPEEPISSQEARSIIAEIEGAPDAAAEKLRKQGTSDEVSDIEADINATDLGDLDKEMNNIELHSRK